MPRFWTVDEARAYLPRLRELVERVRDGALATERVRGNGGSGPDAGLDEALSELSDGDIILRDTETSLIDFHAVGSDIERGISELRDALKTDDADVIKKKMELLTQASHKLAEEMYKAQSAPGGGGAGPGPEASTDRGTGGGAGVLAAKAAL